MKKMTEALGSYEKALQATEGALDELEDRIRGLVSCASRKPPNGHSDGYTAVYETGLTSTEV